VAAVLWVGCQLLGHAIFRAISTNYEYEQVKEDQQGHKKPSFANFKNAVWHESFYKLLESIVQLRHTGYWFEGLDKIRYLLWPLILILSADYEEQ
jgi:hypothetical protein